MDHRMNRREFMESAVAAGTVLAAAGSVPVEAAGGRTVRVGVVGTGNRGRGLLGVMLAMKGVEFPALCDIDATNLAQARDMVEKSGRPRPEEYFRGDHAYEKLMERDDLDAVIIAAPWQWHTPMAVYAMQHGKYAGVEVPAALTLEECWELVNTSERTGVPCMMLENWSFRQDNLAVLNMIRAGLFGEIVHAHCAHSHDCIDHWFFDPQGNIRWGGEFLIRRNCDQYPTHSLGPVLSWMDINCGDAFAALTSTATDSRGINAYFARKFGPDHPNARRKYKQGDIVTSLVRTHQGKTIVINYDMQLPRPYDNRWMVQGTLGLYDEDKFSLYIEDQSPKYHEWEPFAPWQERHEHSWWKEMRANPNDAGHGGTDWLELAQFLEAVRARTQTPVDVYDSATMSSVVALSERSIEKGGAPVACPDFTRGKWKTRKPVFAVEG